MSINSPKTSLEELLLKTNAKCMKISIADKRNKKKKIQKIINMSYARSYAYTIDIVRLYTFWVRTITVISGMLFSRLFFRRKQNIKKKVHSPKRDIVIVV